MRIDAHTHVQPPLTQSQLAALSEREPYWGFLLDPQPLGRSAQGWADELRMIADMDAAGVDAAVIQGAYYRSHRRCVAATLRHQRMARRSPGRLLVFGAVQPLAGDAAVAEVERLAASGAAGVGELNPYGQGFGLEDAAFLRIAEACIRHDLPLNLHISEDVGRDYAGRSTVPPSAYYALALRYPELRLILAHWGGGLALHEIVPEVRRALANTWYDTAASPLLYPTAAIFPAAIAAAGAHKILFGSDYPLRLYPRTQPQADMRPFLSEIGALGLDSQTEAALLGGNMARLLARRESRAAPPPPPTSLTTPLAGPQPTIELITPVRQIAERQPQTKAVLEAYGIPWRAGEIPPWERLGQAAAAHGHGPAARARLLAELRAACGSS